MKISAKEFKNGYLYIKNGYTIYYSCGNYVLSYLYNCETFKTLNELKNKLKNF